MSPITHLEYPLDETAMIESINNARKESRSYSDPRCPERNFDYWKIGHYTDDNIQKIMHDFGIVGKPRFYWLAPHAKLPIHIDNGTQCSINFVLSPNAAPVTYGDNNYFYKQALINTSIPHSVSNGPEERILFKISIFDNSYEELSSSIKFKAG